MDELMRWLRHWFRRPQADPATPVGIVTAYRHSPGFALPDDDSSIDQRSARARASLDRMQERRTALLLAQKRINLSNALAAASPSVRGPFIRFELFRAEPSPASHGYSYTHRSRASRWHHEPSQRPLDLIRMRLRASRSPAWKRTEAAVLRG